MNQDMGGMKQVADTAKKASKVDDDAVTIAADDAGATAAAQKTGEALEDDQPDNATPHAAGHLTNRHCAQGCGFCGERSRTGQTGKGECPPNG